jgi:hypothetical protein
MTAYRSGRSLRVPPQDAAQLVGREPTAVVASRLLLGAVDERAPETAVELRPPVGPFWVSVPSHGRQGT